MTRLTAVSGSQTPQKYGRTVHKNRPCCGRRYDLCQCKPAQGLKKKRLDALAKCFLETPLSTVGDTTDVSAWKDLMQEDSGEANKRKLRFLNVAPEQEKRRRARVTMARLRAVRGSQTPQKCGRTVHRNRPCCGRRYDLCQCKPPEGLNKERLDALAKRFLETPLSTVGDTTDVSAWKDLMQDRSTFLPTSVLLGYAYVHVVFNQTHLLRAILEENAFTFESPWVDWIKLRTIVERAKARQLTIRSSNFYSTTLRDIMPQSGFERAEVPKNPVDRDVLACKIVGFDAVPAVVCELYDRAPSRDLWKAMLQQWLAQAHNLCKGAMADYYMKCCLDRLIAVRGIDHGTISWWPTGCPSYIAWYKPLLPNGQCVHEEDRFRVLCFIYRRLNSVRSCTIAEALAQTCWSVKEEKGRLILV